MRHRHPQHHTPRAEKADAALRSKQLELDAVMQLAVDKWLDDDDTEGNPATRAARAPPTS